MTTYRGAVPSDIADLVRLAKEMHSSTSFKDISFNEVKTAIEIATFMSGRQNFICVAEKDGHLVGFVAVYLSTPFFSDDPVVYDHVWFVSEEVRGGFTGPRLLKYVSQWAKIQGAKACFLTLGSDVSSDRVGKMAEHLGYRRLGGFYRKDL